ncbi:hypothetical protein KBC04_00470 [Candidatus Babeliales bacterium]|nr:hypothetical protein [Candidatus Babeliales bacterium]MBP9843434.1 hypothetical protein [Candidatus Babeliales bacterium]
MLNYKKLYNFLILWFLYSINLQNLFAAEESESREIRLEDIILKFSEESEIRDVQEDIILKFSRDEAEIRKHSYWAMRKKFPKTYESRKSTYIGDSPELCSLTYPDGTECFNADNLKIMTYPDGTIIHDSHGLRRIRMSDGKQMNIHLLNSNSKPYMIHEIYPDGEVKWFNLK